jgi:hypothetical protein
MVEKSRAPQAIETGSRAWGENCICGTFRRITAGSETYRANILSTCTVSGGKALILLKRIPRETNSAMMMKLSMALPPFQIYGKGGFYPT